MRRLQRRYLICEIIQFCPKTRAFGLQDFLRCMHRVLQCRRIIAPDGSDLGPMNVWEANEMLARLESQEVGND